MGVTDILDSAGHFLDPLSIGIVFGGAALATALRSTRADIAAALAALRPLVRADPAADALAARVAIERIETLAEARGLNCVDRAQFTGSFLRRAALHLADARTAQSFADWAEDEMASMRARHERAAAVWRALADAAPGMGMIGTVIGLIRMFAAMNDAAALGPAMALAMLTTLYGLVLGSGIAGPIAARLERLSQEEQAWRAWVCKRLDMLARAELDPVAARRVMPLRSVA